MNKNGADLTAYGPVERLKRLPIKVFAMVAIGLGAAVTGAFEWRDAHNRLRKMEIESKQLDSSINQVQRLQAQIETLNRENARLKSELKGRERFSSSERLGVKSKLNEVAAVYQSSVQRFNNGVDPRVPLAQVTIPANDLRQILWIAFIALTSVYLLAFAAIIFSKNANTITFAQDLLKTLTGFYIGVVTGVMGLRP